MHSPVWLVSLKVLNEVEERHGQQGADAQDDERHHLEAVVPEQFAHWDLAVWTAGLRKAGARLMITIFANFHQFSPIFANFRPKLWRFSYKPML
jgi:hypothetical protein